MTNHVCVSVSGPTYSECIEQISDYTFIELRLDLLTLSDEELSALFKRGLTILATCRPEKKGRDFQTEMLQKAIQLGANYIDIEIESISSETRNLIYLAELKGCKRVVSYHNYTETPGIKELHSIIEHAKQFNANLVKIACMVKNEKDNARISSLYATHENIVAFGMGEKGKITRIASLFFGAPFTFAAPSNNKITAPGQYTAADLATIIRNINRNA